MPNSSGESSPSFTPKIFTTCAIHWIIANISGIPNPGINIEIAIHPITPNASLPTDSQSDFIPFPIADAIPVSP